MNDNVNSELLASHSYLWIAAKSLAKYLGYADMVDFLKGNYYIKVNLTADTVIEANGELGDISEYPRNFAGFMGQFCEQQFPGQQTDALVAALNRNVLLSSFEAREYFLEREFPLYDTEQNMAQLKGYCQMFVDHDEVHAAILLINVSDLYHKSGHARGLSEFDTVSGFFSRSYGERVGVEQLRHHPDKMRAAIAIHLDDFADIVSHRGHRVANSVIVDIAARIADVFEQDGVICRRASDEFLVLMEADVENDVERALKALCASNPLDEGVAGRIDYEISFGYALYPADSREYSELCSMAEMAAEHAAEHEYLRFERSMLNTTSRSLGFNIMDIANGIPGAILVYRAHGSEEILYANDETVRLFDCDDFDDFMEHVHGSFRGFVYADDLDRVENEIWSQINQKDTQNVDYVEYRILTKNGVLRNIDDIGRLVNSPYYGEIFYVFLHDMDKKSDIVRGMMAGVS